MNGRKSSCRDVKYTHLDKDEGDETFVALNETNFYFKRQISIHLLRVGEGGCERKIEKDFRGLIKSLSRKLGI